MSLFGHKVLISSRQNRWNIQQVTHMVIIDIYLIICLIIFNFVSNKMQFLLASLYVFSKYSFPNCACGESKARTINLNLIWYAEMMCQHQKLKFSHPINPGCYFLWSNLCYSKPKMKGEQSTIILGLPQLLFGSKSSYSVEMCGRGINLKND